MSVGLKIGRTLDRNQMMRPFSSLLNRRVLWPVFLIGTLAILVLVPILPAPYGSSEVLVAAVGGLWAFAFYLHQRHAEDARFMKDLLTEFNCRYNELNDTLQSAHWSDALFNEAVRLKFIDYFNLCAEEWLFWKAGYIYEEVWTAWHNGMKQYGKDSRVKRLWEEEARSNSYYGFQFPICDTKTEAISIQAESSSERNN